MSSHTNNHLQIKKIKIKIATEWKHFIINGKINQDIASITANEWTVSFVVVGNHVTILQ